MTETLDTLINKIEAMFDCKAGTPTKLAKHLGKPPQRISEYIRSRIRKPKVADYEAMKVWAAGINTRIAQGSRAIQSAYRESYKNVCYRRRVKD